MRFVLCDTLLKRKTCQKTCMIEKKTCKKIYSVPINYTSFVIYFSSL